MRLPFFQKSSSTVSIPREIQGPRILFLLATLALLLFGLVMVYSASFVEAINEGDDPASYMVKQVGYAVIGVGIAWAFWRVLRPEHLRTGLRLYLGWAFFFLLNLLTAVIGTEELGARRWLYLGIGSLQPSEFMKIVIVAVAARLFCELRDGASPKDVAVKAVVFVIVPVGVIFSAQSDLGTTVICLVGVLAVLWIGEVPMRYVVSFVVVGTLLAIIAVTTVGYRSSRFAYLDPWNDGYGGYGSGYAIIHSYYAFAEGGLFGVGLGNSREKYLYLPEAETDFIFSIVGEELGLVGAVLLIALFLVFLYAGLRIAKSARNDFGAMLAGGLTIMIVFQAFLNIGCAIGLLPTTGKPLPFISLGGSSLIATLMMVGIILGVSKEAEEKAMIHEARRDDLRLVRFLDPSASESISAGGRRPGLNRKR